MHGIAPLCLIAAAVLLTMLSVIDLKIRLLPNQYVAAFAALAPVFHYATDWHYLSPQAMIAGGIAGFAVLFAIRAVANKIYNQDALGLGDVKLLGAAGLWLGPDMVMLAMAAGAFAAVLHGLGYALYRRLRHGEKIDLSGLQIPAGPGFAAGIAAAGLWMGLS